MKIKPGEFIPIEIGDVPIHEAILQIRQDNQPSLKENKKKSDLSLRSFLADPNPITRIFHLKRRK